MIVKYARDGIYKAEGRDPPLTLGKEYLVLGMTISLADNIHRISLQSDLDSYPGSWKVEAFDIVDPRIPNDWSFVEYGDGYYGVDPEECTGDFWKKYNDGTQEEGEHARRILANVIIKIKRFHDRWDL